MFSLFREEGFQLLFEVDQLEMYISNDRRLRMEDVGRNGDMSTESLYIVCYQVFDRSSLVCTW